MQAIILAAGMGKRLGRYTKDATKCMVEVNGKALIEYAIEALVKAKVSRTVLVVGYKADVLKNFIASKFNEKNLGGMKIEYIENKVYDTTNNIYSFYLARNELLKDDTILLESDLIFKKKILQDLIASPEKNLAVLSHFESWMDGTVVTLDKNDNIKSFVAKNILESKTPSAMESVMNFLKQTGFALIAGDLRYLIMILIACVLFYLAIVKKFEPLLLMPIAFGMFLINLPGAHDVLWGIQGEGVAYEDVQNKGLLWYLFFGVQNVIYPPLIFLGIGAMTDFGPSYAENVSVPWADNRADIKTVVINEGVTSIGNNAFVACSNMTTVIMPNSITRIGEHSFENCFKLAQVDISGIHQKGLSTYG